MRVNNEEADPGCYIEGSRGQYGMDYIADVAEQFGMDVAERVDPRYWRKLNEEAESQIDVDYTFDMIVGAADMVEAMLNSATEGGHWEWLDGEFFLVQTQVEGWLYVPVLADEGEDYDDAWQKLLDHGPEEGVVGYDNCRRGDTYHRFLITIQYDPEGE